MLLLAVGLALGGTPRAACAQEAGFTFNTSIPVPFAPTFMATGPRGELYIGAHNMGSGRDASAYVVDSPSTEFSPRAFDTEAFEPGRGYAGVAVDGRGNVFVVGDTGAGETCFLKKFTPSLVLDSTFGILGVRRNFPLRLFGIAAVEDRLVVAMAGGNLSVFDAVRGDYLYTIPGDVRSQVRDLAIEPTGQQIFGIGSGAVLWWNQGSVTGRLPYGFQLLGEPTHESSPFEGLAFHPYLAAVMYCDRNPGAVKSMTGAGTAVLLAANSNPNFVDFCDVAYSADYQVLYVSDPVRRAIHCAVYAGAVNPLVPKGGLVGRPLDPASASLSPYDPSAVPGAGRPQVQKDWYTELPQIYTDAMNQSKKMAVYYRSDRARACRELESSLLSTPGLFEKFPQALWMRVDVLERPDLAQGLGIVKVPTIVVHNELGVKIQVLGEDQITEASLAQNLAPGIGTP